MAELTRRYPARELAEPKLGGETVLAAIARLRKQVDAARAKLGRTAAAPLPGKLVKAHIRREIEAAAKAPVIRATADGEAIAWQQTRIAVLGTSRSWRSPRVWAAYGLKAEARRPPAAIDL